MIKSILGGKSKNLFDISKVVTSNVVKRNGNSLICSSYGTSIGTLGSICPTLKPSDLITISFKCASEGVPSKFMAFGGRTFYSGATFLVSDIGLSTPWCLYSTDYAHSGIPNKTTYSDIQVELGSTATEYVPHELTSYKSIMKVSDVCQLVDKSKFWASDTQNGITWVSNGDGSITLNGTCTSGFVLNPFNQEIPVDQTHLYYSSPYVSINYGGAIDGTDETGHISFLSTSAFPTKFNTVFYIWIDKDKSFSNVTTFINIGDLTEMFGAGNEPKTVAEFKAKFPNDYYPYSPSCFVTSFDERMPCKTKNLFSSSTEVGVPSSTKFDQSEKRLLEDGKWYVGFSDNNYYSVSNIIDYKIFPNQVYIKTAGSGYGVAKCFYCEPSTTYVLSSKASLVSGSKLQVGIGYYQEDGTWISRVDIYGGGITFNTPANCRYCTLCFVPTDAKGAAYFSDIQLVKGTTATDYVPYGYV